MKVEIIVRYARLMRFIIKYETLPLFPRSRQIDSKIRFIRMFLHDRL